VSRSRFTRARAGLAVTGCAALALAGCGSGDAPTERRGPTRIANPYADQLKALTPQNQRLTLMRAVRDNGKRCGRVESAAYQEEYRNMALWVVLCEEGRHWGIFIAPNGDTQVRECTQMQQLDLPRCRPLTGVPTAGREG
jgi:hypothetical protein